MMTYPAIDLFLTSTSSLRSSKGSLPPVSTILSTPSPHCLPYSLPTANFTQLKLLSSALLMTSCLHVIRKSYRSCPTRPIRCIWHDYTILLSRLSSTFSITGRALDFLTSYVVHRTQSVCNGSDSSPASPLLTGVPQGFVLGPLLFCLYTTPLTSMLSSSPVKPHFYADDTQLYISFSAADLTASLQELTSVLDLTHTWLTSNRLSVNPSKAEFLLIGTPQQRLKVMSPSIQFQGTNPS